jgi:hypothetical protein
VTGAILPWRKATPSQVFGDGDRLLVSGVNPHNGKRWYDSVNVECDEGYFDLAYDNGESSDLIWSDIDYWLYASEIPPPRKELP